MAGHVGGDKPVTKLLWLDLEMTGLDPDSSRIVEVAAIITDIDGNELEVFEAVVKQPPSVLKTMEAWSRQHHSQSALLSKIPDGISEMEAEAAVLEMVERHFKEPAVLAGNTIHWDRRFIRRYWPKLEAKLHYRMLDVSALKIIMQSKYRHFFKGKKNHRALEDIRESIAELKDYLAYFQNGSGS